METPTHHAAAEDRAQRLTVAALGLAFVAAATAMFLQLTLVFAALVALILTLAAALGAIRNGQLGPFKPFFAAALLVWVVAFAGMHWLPSSTETLVLGLPPATAVSLLVLWLAPLFLITLPYGLYFDDFVLPDAAFDEISRFVDSERST